MGVRKIDGGEGYDVLNVKSASYTSISGSAENNFEVDNNGRLITGPKSVVLTENIEDLKINGQSISDLDVDAYIKEKRETIKENDKLIQFYQGVDENDRAHFLSTSKKDKLAGLEAINNKAETSIRNIHKLVNKFSGNQEKHITLLIKTNEQ